MKEPTHAIGMASGIMGEKNKHVMIILKYDEMLLATSRVVPSHRTLASLYVS